MVYDNETNVFCESAVRAIGGCMLDANNILWKLVDGKWVGKRSVFTKDLRASWLEDTKVEDVKSWWCGGRDTDYTQIFLPYIKTSKHSII